MALHYSGILYVYSTEPATPGPFHDLTKQELGQLREFLENDVTIKAAKAETATMDQSNIYNMDLALPPKVGQC